ncbi:rCG44150, isoform CRA_b [Rattus norvegicus]|uniref:RCG44150, isoform CRA_b n=1 Tax=Rattus norvegicus TaxID=10116 RepID=A6J7P3_RAT|nr:rCG44150, isoform CRA_b [Rattus norvegicus]
MPWDYSYWKYTYQPVAWRCQDPSKLALDEIPSTSSFRVSSDKVLRVLTRLSLCGLLECDAQEFSTYRSIPTCLQKPSHPARSVV